MPKYEKLSQEISDKIAAVKSTVIYSDASFKDECVVRRRSIAKDNGTVWRPTFVRACSATGAAFLFCAPSRRAPVRAPLAPSRPP